VRSWFTICLTSLLPQEYLQAVVHGCVSPGFFSSRSRGGDAERRFTICLTSLLPQEYLQPHCVLPPLVPIFVAGPRDLWPTICLTSLLPQEYLQANPHEPATIFFAPAKKRWGAIPKDRARISTPSPSVLPPGGGSRRRSYRVCEGRLTLRPERPALHPNPNTQLPDSATIRVLIEFERAADCNSGADLC
jgi:hypothetical protein